MPHPRPDVPNDEFLYRRGGIGYKQTRMPVLTREPIRPGEIPRAGDGQPEATKLRQPLISLLELPDQLADSA